MNCKACTLVAGETSIMEYGVNTYRVRPISMTDHTGLRSPALRYPPPFYFESHTEGSRDDCDAEGDDALHVRGALPSKTFPQLGLWTKRSGVQLIYLTGQHVLVKFFGFGDVSIIYRLKPTC